MYKETVYMYYKDAIENVNKVINKIVHSKPIKLGFTVDNFVYMCIINSI